MYEKLLEPGTIGRMNLRNRIVMSPTETHFTASDGMLTWPEIDYYARRAKGGVGLIITQQTQACAQLDPIDPYPRSARLDDDAYIPMMSELTEAVHLQGAKIAVLLTPGGGAQAMGSPYETGRSGIDEPMNVGPSEIRCPVADRPVRRLSVEEIHQFVRTYGQSALRAKKAGFDAVAIHAHAGYLISQFLSPFFNNRDDEYGGSLANRARFLLELVAEVRRVNGPMMPIIVRLSADDGIGEKGRQIKDTVELAKMLENAGVDAIDIAGGTQQVMAWVFPTIYHEKGMFTSYAGQVRQAVSIPVLVSGRMQDLEFAESVLEKGEADFISFARPLIADPDLANKLKAGEGECVRRCVGCNHCIGVRIWNNNTLRCAINPLAGRESRYPQGVSRTDVKKHVAVIGGGAAGCEAAYTAALRGHEVDLYERASELCGGQVKLASAPPCKDILHHIPKFFTAVFAKMENVHVHLNTEMTAEDVKSLKADTVLLATGGQIFVPGIPGVKGNPNVIPADKILDGTEKLTGKVLIAGGGQIGIETAHLLHEQGLDVTVVEMLGDILMKEEPLTRATIMPVILGSGMQILTDHRIEKVSEHAVTVTDLHTQEAKDLPFDTMVMALGTKPYNPLESAAREAFSDVRVIGDAQATANIAEATKAGFFAGLNI